MFLLLVPECLNAGLKGKEELSHFQCAFFWFFNQSFRAHPTWLVKGLQLLVSVRSRRRGLRVNWHKVEVARLPNVNVPPTNPKNVKATAPYWSILFDLYSWSINLGITLVLYLWFFLAVTSRSMKSTFFFLSSRSPSWVIYFLLCLFITTETNAKKERYPST